MENLIVDLMNIVSNYANGSGYPMDKLEIDRLVNKVQNDWDTSVEKPYDVYFRYCDGRFECEPLGGM